MKRVKPVCFVLAVASLWGFGWAFVSALLSIPFAISVVIACFGGGSIGAVAGIFASERWLL